jgi:hypothetical protein
LVELDAALTGKSEPPGCNVPIELVAHQGELRGYEFERPCLWIIPSSNC